MSNNGLLIKMLYDESIAQEAGIEVGDILISINGENVNDTIEYRYLICDENISLILKNKIGEEYIVEIEKDQYEDIGIEFEDPYLENAMSCKNKCIFCFIDQLPKGMRKTLYFKDDDSRLSFLQGNFVTLTNLKDEDFDRIIKYKISPINVSVHTTNPELRVKMLNNKLASNIKDRLRQLVDGGIRLNCQIVLCPGINDGVELEKSLTDLFEFYPGISNVAIVPVGITKFREGLYKMDPYEYETSREVIKLVDRLQKTFYDKMGDNFARLSDEFYITAAMEVPDYEHYGDFEQVEDGIGMIRYFDATVKEELDYTEFTGNDEEIAIITGEMCSSYMKEITATIEKRLKLKIKVYTIKNNLFGGKVSVAGLLTGKDILEQTAGILKERAVFIPRNMLRADEEQNVFLDDMTLEDLEKGLNTKLILCKYTGEDLIENITNEVREWQNQ
jgi:putative radical SAM enzyme (TIGR03279 family)